MELKTPSGGNEKKLAVNGLWDTKSGIPTISEGLLAKLQQANPEKSLAIPLERCAHRDDLRRGARDVGTVNPSNSDVADAEEESQLYVTDCNSAGTWRPDHSWANEP